MNVDQAKFQKKFDSRAISRELPYDACSQVQDICVILLAILLNFT